MTSTSAPPGVRDKTSKGRLTRAVSVTVTRLAVRARGGGELLEPPGQPGVGDVGLHRGLDFRGAKR